MLQCAVPIAVLTICSEHARARVPLPLRRIFYGLQQALQGHGRLCPRAIYYDEYLSIDPRILERMVGT